MAWYDWWNWWGKDKHDRSIADFGVWLHKNYWMEAHQIKDYWWGLPEEHKRRIANELIPAYTQHIQIKEMRKNKHTAWVRASCHPHTTIRMCLLGDIIDYAPVLAEADYRYTSKVRSWQPKTSLGLPVFHVVVTRQDLEDGQFFGHSVCGLYCGNIMGGWDEIHNWWFFQYGDFNIPLDGSIWQIPSDAILQPINHTHPDVKITSGSYAYYGDTDDFYITTFKL